MPARSSTHWLTKILAVSILLGLSVLQSCTALLCGCNQDHFLSDCRYSNPLWTCPLYPGQTMCGVIRNRKADGSIKRVELCMEIATNPLVCNGTFNSASRVYQCCDDQNYCNRYLNPLLPGEVDAVLSSSATVSSSSTVELAPLLCTCSNPKRCSGSTFCRTNYKCYRHDTLAADRKTRDTELGCLDSVHFVNYDKIDICSSTRDTKTSWFRCCNDNSHCNRDLKIDVEIPSVGAGRSDSTNESLVNSNDSLFLPTTDDSKNDDVNFYFIFTLIMLVFPMVTVITTIVIVGLGLLWLRVQRGRAKVASSVFHTRSEKSFHKPQVHFAAELPC